MSNTGSSDVRAQPGENRSSQEKVGRGVEDDSLEREQLAFLTAPSNAIDRPKLACEFPGRDVDPTAKVKILVVDVHTMTRIGLRVVLGMQERYAVVGEAAAGVKALKQVKDLQPDLVLMDIHLPDASGIEITRRILDAHPGIKVVIISSDVSRDMIDKALEIGVCGYLSKGSSLEELLRAVEAVLAGKLYMSAEASGEILKDYRSRLREKPRKKTSLVSEQEKALLQLISRGLRNKEIAAELHVTSKSVEAYRSRLMKKLHCSSPAELVLYAIREGITRP